ncbi:Fic family protein [Leucothrix arctica]|uniref:Cell filamentation protein Fic n=1 Tax=Leucothrix arctica TaxID=1481894 RepID=A0A317C3I2_9GAMM|nr:Fic family protein [Leucothrix arctica]PWQ93205.1 cell filamentation protein Fic [Leucothrix arctica]
MPTQPPFTISANVIHLVSRISESLGRINQDYLQSSPQLRKQNRIKTIAGTLAIEGNTLSLEQITAIMEGKHVLGEPKEIAEVHGAIAAYEKLPEWRANSEEDFLAAHGLLMSEILKDAGKFRSQGVGIHQGEKVVHVAPQANRVPLLVQDLFNWAETSDQHPLIVSSVVHYELEFIHPFMDGNGRMGRLWQTLLLGQWKPVFFLLPLESVIKDRQQAYYDALGAADKATDSLPFIEFILEAIDSVLQENLQNIDTESDQVTDQASDQVKSLLKILDIQYLAVPEMMERLSLSHRTYFRKNYLNPAIKLGLVEMSHPEKPRSPKQKYRKQQ